MFSSFYCTDSRPRWHQKGFCIVLVHWCTGEMNCIGTSSIADSSEVASGGLRNPRRTRGVSGITTKYPDGEFKCSEISPCQLVSCTFQHCEWAVWKIELGFRERLNTFVHWANVFCSAGSGLHQRLTRTTITKCVPLYANTH